MGEQGYMSPEQFSLYMSSMGHTDGKDGAHWLAEVFYPKLKRILSIILRAGLPQLSTLPGYFALFGLDLLMDSQHHIYMSEMNFSPSLSWIDVGKYREAMSTILV